MRSAMEWMARLLLFLCVTGQVLADLTVGEVCRANVGLHALDYLMAFEAAKGEDRFLAGQLTCGEESYILFAVIDGHGGAAMSDFVATSLAQRLLTEHAASMDIPRLITETFASIDGRIQLDSPNYKIFSEDGQLEQTGGACVAILLIGQDAMYMAHVGHCRVYLAQEGEFVATASHNGKSEQERNRVSLSGGSFAKNCLIVGDRHLRVTRALGNFCCCPASGVWQKAEGLSCMPEVRKIARTYFVACEPVKILLATDGLFRTPQASDQAADDLNLRDPVVIKDLLLCKDRSLEDLARLLYEQPTSGQPPATDISIIVASLQLGQ